MPSPSPETCWTVLQAAASGDANARTSFAESYAAPIRAYLGHRWRGGAQAGLIDDAVHDVFVECMKPGGVLEGADPAKGEFRALLYAVVRNVARRHEERTPGTTAPLDELPDRAEALSRFFDRSWAESIVRDALLRHARTARRSDVEARRRFRILRLRHEKDLPIRAIAAQLGLEDVDVVHNAYRRARREYREHLREAVARHTGVASQRLDEECRHVIELLGR